MLGETAIILPRRALAYNLVRFQRRCWVLGVGLMLDCAKICQTSANFMLRSSGIHSRTCGVWAEVCEGCAQDCERLGDDADMRACADLCKHMAAMAA
jgi:hypothetical protein